MTILTIPSKLTRRGELVVMPRKEYEALVGRRQQEEAMNEEDALQLSREARRLKRAGKLSSFRGFIAQEYPSIARKYGLKRQK